MAEGDAAGGSGALAELIDEHGAALYCDFQSYYHLDLVEVVRERPARFVLALVEGLPDNENYAASVQGGPEFRGWGVDRHLRANHIDVAAVAGGVVANKGSKAPLTQWRPGKKKRGGPMRLLSMIGKDM